MMSTFETRLSDKDDCNITLFHDPEDPSSWVIRKWKKLLFWRRIELSRWFATREQAEDFARELIENCERQRRKAS